MGLIDPCSGDRDLVTDALLHNKAGRFFVISPSTGGCGRDFADREIFSVGRPGGPMVLVRSKELADRMAKAMNHAIVLCGKEPF
jgi:hypothetical protein